MYRVVHDFLEKSSGTQYKVGDEYKGKDAEKLAVRTKFRPALVVEEKPKAKAPTEEKEGEKPVVEEADEKPKAPKKK